jgi:hypothetical protein
MPRLKCLSALGSINYQIAIFGLLTAAILAANSSLGHSARSADKSLIYDSPGQEEAQLAVEIGPERALPAGRDIGAIFHHILTSPGLRG